MTAGPALAGRRALLRPGTPADVADLVAVFDEDAVRRWWHRGHHRITIDPAAGNARAIRAYETAGFRTVGVMRAYETLPDGSHRDGLLMEHVVGADG